MRKILFVIVLPLLLSCAPSKPLQLPLSYEGHEKGNGELINCSKELFFLDTRKNKSMGQMSGFPVGSDTNIADWLAQATVIHFGKGVKVNWSTKSGEPENWFLELKNVYAKHQSTSVAATTVFILRNRAQRFKKVYRGNVTRVNWASGEAETQEVLNQALKDGLTKMKPDLIRICKQNEPV